jgi:hypothetical protein
MTAVSGGVYRAVMLPVILALLGEGGAAAEQPRVARLDVDFSRTQFDGPLTASLSASTPIAVTFDGLLPLRPLCVLKIERAVAGANAGWVKSGTVLVDQGRLVEPDATVVTDGCGNAGECPTRKDFTPRLLGGVVASAGESETLTFNEPLWIQMPEAMEVNFVVDCGAFGQTESFRVERHYPFAIEEADKEEDGDVPSPVELNFPQLVPRQYLQGSNRQPFISMYRRRLVEEATTTSTGPKKVCVRSSHLVLYGLVVVIASFGSFWLLAPCFKTQRVDDNGMPDYDDDEFDDDSEDEDEDGRSRRRKPVKHGAIAQEMGGLEQQQYDAQMQQQQQQQQAEQQVQYEQQQQQYEMQVQQQQYDMQAQQQYDLQMQQQQAIPQQPAGGQPFVEHSL